MGLYDDTGTSGDPGKLVAGSTTGEFTTVSGDNTIDITDISVSAGDYYLVYWSDKTLTLNMNTGGTTSRTIYYRSLAYSSSAMPSSFGTATDFNWYNFNIYGTFY